MLASTIQFSHNTTTHTRKSTTLLACGKPQHNNRLRQTPNSMLTYVSLLDVTGVSPPGFKKNNNYSIERR